MGWSRGEMSGSAGDQRNLSDLADGPLTAPASDEQSARPRDDASGWPLFRSLDLVLALIQANVIGGSLFLYLRGWRRDFHVPLGFTIDSLFYLMQAKSTVDNGWWWFNPMVGAPFGLDELAFPANGNVDQAIVWTVSRFLADAITAINLTWLVMVVLSGLAATWCMRRLGISRASAFVGGTLFALSPYALYRNIAHFGMVIYVVPFVCTAALQLASGRLPSRGYMKGSGLVVLLGCLLLSFNYVYYPFFGCFFILLATIVGWANDRRASILRGGALILIVLVGATILNLAPSVYSWHARGKPVILVDKYPAQAELYALKVRTLVSPAFEHAFPPFRRWTEKEAYAQFPLETENMTSRLGSVGTVGFLGLLALLIVPAAPLRLQHYRILLAGAQLTIAGILLATVGGFGSLFSLLVSPQIRAYSRICPFLEFFALVAVGMAIDAVPKRRATRLAAASLVLAVGLVDQSMAAAGMNREYLQLVGEMPNLRGFVHQLERKLPPQSMVLQLPFRQTYLNDSGVARMQPYEHFKLYLVSHQLRWSFPALSNEQVAWQQAAAALDPTFLPHQMVREGFSAIVVDRYGYQDNGTGVLAAIRAGLRDEDVVAETERYVALDIRRLAAMGRARTRLTTELSPATISMRACDGQAIGAIEQIGSERVPFGPVTAVRGSRPLKVSGWAIDNKHRADAAAVDIVVDARPYPSFYGSDRTDVAAVYGSPAFSESGFTGEIPGNTLRAGQHALSVRVVSSNRDCYYPLPALAISVD